MSDAPRSARSFKKIEREDLDRLAEIGLATLENASKRRLDLPDYDPKDIIGICLCQGAADHHLAYPSRKSCGIHDFDVWAFFKPRDGVRFGNRKAATADFGPSKFGRSPLDNARFEGRRVDVFWRSIPLCASWDPHSSIHLYFEESETATARELSKKSAIIIWPDDFSGVVWNPNGLGFPASYDPWD